MADLLCGDYTISKRDVVKGWRPVLLFLARLAAGIVVFGGDGSCQDFGYSTRKAAKRERIRVV